MLYNIFLIKSTVASTVENIIVGNADGIVVMALSIDALTGMTIRLSGCVWGVS